MFSLLKMAKNSLIRDAWGKVVFVYFVNAYVGVVAHYVGKPAF